MSSKMTGTPHNLHRLKYRYFMFCKTTWAKVHRLGSLVHKYLFRVHQRTRIKTLKFITFSLALKVFKLCNFCFEKHCFFLALADHIAEGEALRLKRD